MALLAQGFDPSGYTPSYAVANAANEQFFQNQQQGLQNISKGIEDYSKQQKDLAQKDKEMAAKIKGTISLLDNAKALYPDFAERIDATKLQLVDPSLSNLDKLGIAGNVESSLNMMVTKGSDATKTALQIAELQQRERMAGMGSAPKAKTEVRQVYDSKLGTNIDVLVNLDTGEFKPIGPAGETAMPMDETATTSVPMPTTGQTNLGAPPMMAPTIEGPEIPVNESQLIKSLPNGDELRVYQGKQYTVPSPSVLPPMQQPSTAQPSAIGDAAALPIEPVQAQPSAIGSVAAMTPPVAQQPRFQAPREAPEKIKERELRQKLTESTIAANTAAAAKAASETQAKEEKVILSQAQAKAAAQDARATIRQSVAEVNKFADKIGSNVASDIWKYGTQFLSSSDQARLNQAIKPISSAMIWDQMSKLRAASATGSTGLGSLTEGERKNLESTIASLDAMQDPRDIKIAMRKIEDYMNNAEYGNWFEREQLVKSGKMSPVRFNEIEKKYLKPVLISESSTSRFTPEQEALRNKYK